MRRLQLSFLFFSLFATGCIAHRTESGHHVLRQRTGQILAKEAADAVKTPAEMEQESQNVGQMHGSYFAKLQILTESDKSASCTKDQSRVEEKKQGYVGALDASNKLKMNSDQPVHSLFNIQWRAIGFDELRYHFSILNGKVMGTAPYPISVHMRPNHSVELKIFDKAVELKLESTPIYTFTVVEHRGSCEIAHNVNVFAENAGYFGTE